MDTLMFCTYEFLSAFVPASLAVTIRWMLPGKRRRVRPISENHENRLFRRENDFRRDNVFGRENESRQESNRNSRRVCGRKARTGYLLILVFLIYITAVYHYTGAGTFYDALRNGIRMYGISGSYNLHPFSLSIDRTGYLLNVLLFVPFGVLVPLIWRQYDSFHAVFLMGALFSLLIEMSQLLNVRATDVDDLIMNTAGAVLGYMLLCLARILKRKPVRDSRANDRVSDAPGNMFIICILASYSGWFFLNNSMALARILYGF